MTLKICSIGALSFLCVLPSLAQAPDSTIGEVDMKTNVGSFKILSPGDVKAFGKVQMNFRGTCLIVGYEGKTPIQVSNGLHLEYKNDQRQRVEYFGQGSITLDGKFKAIQWFGKDLSMNWVGNGICRLYGEFDKDNKTGTYTIKGANPKDWGTAGSVTFSIPSKSQGMKPKVHFNKGGG